MSEDLATNGRTGQKAMFYVGEMPWHRFGVKLDDPPTSREAIVAAGLDYDVVSLPMFADYRPLIAAGRITSETLAQVHGAVPGEDWEHTPVPTQFLNVRADTLEHLGVVSDRYRVVQNHEAFEFLDSLVASGELRYETAGALGRGERVWMLARMPGDIVLPGDDVTCRYLLLSNSHDGGTALRVFFTPIRVVCANTLCAALERAGASGFTFRHTGNVQDKLTEARKVLGLAAGYFDRFGDLAAQLARAELSDAQREAYFMALYPDPERGDPARPKGVRAALWGLVAGQGKGSDMASARGTAWGAYNAVAEFVDHHVPARDSDSVPAAQRRWQDAVWGDGAKVKSRAFDLALATAGLGSAADRALVAVN